MPVGEALRADRANVPGAKPVVAPPLAAALAPVVSRAPTPAAGAARLAVVRPPGRLRGPPPTHRRLGHLDGLRRDDLRRPSLVGLAGKDGDHAVEAGDVARREAGGDEPIRPRLDGGLRPSLTDEPGLDADERERGRVAAEALDVLPHRLAGGQAQELRPNFPGEDEEHQLA